MSVGPLTYRIDSAAGGACVIEGVLDEMGTPVLAAIAKELAPGGQIRLDVGGIKRINSLGVRAWCDFMKKLSGKAVVFVRCSPAFVDQLNTVSDFRGQGRVESFLAPYVCETTGKAFYPELVVGKDIKPGDELTGEGGPLGPRLCADCAEPIVFDDVPERYVHFLTLA